jgi:hypothetical protein
MDDRSNRSENPYYMKQLCLDTESLICCLVADYFLIQRGQVPFASALYYILLNGMNDQIYKQSLLNKKRKLNKEVKVIMTKVDENFTNEINFQCDKTEHFDKSDMPIADENFTNEINFQCDKTEHFVKSDFTKDDENFTNEINFQCDKTEHFDKSDFTKDDENFTNENNFQYDKTYYVDKSGMPMDECEGHRVHSECKKIIETCCLIKIPRGFKLTKCSPGICFNLSGLSCVKNPIMQKVILPACECEHPKKCEVVAGYEIRAVGEVDFSASFPICPINGFCFLTHSYICCSNVVPVNEVISHTCCPKPCACNELCVDWTYAYYCATLVEDNCGPYIRVNMGVALEHTGDCECDEE